MLTHQSLLHSNWKRTAVFGLAKTTWFASGTALSIAKQAEEKGDPFASNQLLIFHEVSAAPAGKDLRETAGPFFTPYFHSSLIPNAKVMLTLLPLGPRMSCIIASKANR